MKNMLSNVDKAEVLINLQENMSLLEYEAEKVASRVYMDEEPEEITPHQHRILVGKAMTHAERMVARGASQAELKRMLVYLLVCIDCQKMQYDVRKAFDELGIKELIDKYHTMWKEKDMEETDE